MPRTPTTAAALDFFIWGVGHAYVGRRKALFFPWVIWTLGFAAWNIIGAIVWVSSASCGCAFATEESVGYYYYSFSVPVVNWGAVLAFFFIPTFIIGGLLAYNVYRSEKAAAMGTIYPSQAPVPAATVTGVFCRSCGASNTPGDAFCANCGAPMGPAPAAQATVPQAAALGTKVCPNCGATNPASNSFCKRCGTRIA